MWWTLLACSSLACSSLACSSCAEPPAPPQELSAKITSIKSSPTPRAWLTILLLLCGYIRCSLASMGQQLLTSVGWAAHHSNGLSLVLLRHCLGVANFLERRACELRRIPLLGRWVNTGQESSLSVEPWSRIDWPRQTPSYGTTGLPL